MALRAAYIRGRSDMRSPGGLQRRIVLTAAAVGMLLAAVVLPARADARRPGPCAWPVEDSPASLGYLWPDLEAHYWMLNLPVVPQAQIRIQGTFPEARYMSLMVYDQGLKAFRGFTDRDLVPDRGPNPFVTRRPPGLGPGTWTAFVEFSPGSPTPGPNRVAVSSDARGQFPNAVVTLLYRVYVPDAAGDRTGGVPLPDVTLETANGAVDLQFSDCGTYPELGGPLTDEVAAASLPRGVAPPRVDPRATEPPAWRVGAGFLSVLPPGAIPEPAAGEVAYRTGDLGTNPDWGYISTFLSRQGGEIAVIRGRAPTFPDTRSGEPPWSERQTRYWSFCVNHLFSLRTVSCTSDFQAALDAQGRYTLVVSSPAQRPANAVPSNGVTWLSTGPFSDVYVDYRQGLPAPGFEEAVQLARPGEDLVSRLGAYYPSIAYCSTATFETGGADGCLGG